MYLEISSRSALSRTCSIVSDRRAPGARPERVRLSKPMKARLLGGVLAVAGALVLVLSARELVGLSGAADAATIAHFDAMTRWDTGTYKVNHGGGYGGATVERAPDPAQMARDVDSIRKVARDVQEGFVILAWFRSYTYDRIRNLSHRLNELGELGAEQAKDAKVVELIRDFADRLSYLLDYGSRTLIGTTIMGLCMLLGGAVAVFTRYGRLGAPLVGIGTAPLFYLNLFDPVQFALIGLAVVLLFLAPSTGVLDRMVERFGAVETEKQLHGRMIAVGLLMLAFSAGISALSFAVAEAIGAASFTVASGGIVYGLYLTVAGLIGRARA